MNKQKLDKIINIQTEEALDISKISELADNALLKVKPELWTEWNFEKNNELNLDIYKTTYGSNQKVDWCCPNCKDIIKNKRIADVNKNRLYCQKCNKGKSIPEMFMYYTLLELGINFEVEKTFDWSDGKRYDFFLPSYNTIIEVHGEQHYTEKFNMAHRTSLEQQIANDRFKKENAIINNIDRYVVIDARKSEKNYLTNNIVNGICSFLSAVDLLDFDKIYKKSLGSIYKEICNLWNNGLTKDEISIQMKLPKDVVTRYLRRSAKDGITSYIVNSEVSQKKSVVKLDSNYTVDSVYNSLTEASKLNDTSISYISYLCKEKKESHGFHFWIYEQDYYQHKNNLSSYGFIRRAQSKSIVQLHYNGDFIKEWETLTTEDSYIQNIGISNIRRALDGVTTFAGGYRWLDKDTYEKYKNDLSLICDFSKRPNNISIVQLTVHGEFVKEWDSITEASVISPSIGMVLNGHYHTAGDYFWMYKDEYNKRKDSTSSNISLKIKAKKKAIVQLTKDGVFVKEWESATEASKQLNQADSSAIQSTLKGKSRTSGGFKWMYKEEYENYSDKLDAHPLFIKNTKTRKKMIGKEIVQLDLNNNLLRIWISLSEAARENGISDCSSISKTCRGITKTSAGYKWMFKDEYDKLMQEKSISK